MNENIITVELIDGCNLKCSLCWNKKRNPSFEQMPLSIVEKIVKKYGDNFKNKICWFNWGDPLLYSEFKSFSEIIEGTNSTISSSFSLPLSNSKFKSLKTIYEIVVSISGLNKEIYNIYNCGGNFNLVMTNIEKLSSLNHKRILFRWQEHKYNKDYYNDAKKFSENFGFIFDPIQLTYLSIEDVIEEKSNKLLEKTYKSENKIMCSLIQRPTIDINGNYLLCCLTRNIKLGFTIMDSISNEELVEIKKNNEFCKNCIEKKYFRIIRSQS